MKQTQKKDIPVKWLKPVTVGVFGAIAACIACVIWVGAKNAKTEKPDITPAAQISEEISEQITTAPQPRAIDPDQFKGMDFEEARSVLQEAGWQINKSKEFDAAVPEGHVIYAEFSADQPGYVTVIVSAGPAENSEGDTDRKTPPDFETLKGMDYHEALKLLDDCGLCAELEWQTSDDVPRGQVIEVQPTEYTGDVLMVVSGGLSDENYVIVPHFIGMEMKIAVSELNRIGLTAECVDRETKAKPEDDSLQYIVVDQSLVPGDQAEVGTEIFLTVKCMDDTTNDVQQVRISTPILRDQDKWVTVDGSRAEQYFELIDRFSMKPAEQSRFDFDGGGLLIELRYDSETTLTYELFSSGLLKCTVEGMSYPKESGNPEYLEETTGNSDKLLWMIQEDLVKVYPQ